MRHRGGRCAAPSSRSRLAERCESVLGRRGASAVRAASLCRRDGTAGRGAAAHRLVGGRCQRGGGGPDELRSRAAPLGHHARGDRRWRSAIVGGVGRGTRRSATECVCRRVAAPSLDEEGAILGELRQSSGEASGAPGGRRLWGDGGSRRRFQDGRRRGGAHGLLRGLPSRLDYTGAAHPPFLQRQRGAAEEDCQKITSQPHTLEKAQ
mmetsp:Transcript_25549/g.81975  ORF Transcript_25549/g.81975 Transcript_25549/m.81975 type:complete len:208 (-) Transcript_25549:48-671(-)